MAASILGHLPVHGAVLIRGLPLHGPADLAEARQALGMSAFTPTEAFAPRRDFGNGVFAPIQWPDDRLLCPFQEGAYSTAPPSVVLTACVTPPETGGEAHLADTRLLTDHLPEGLADRVRKDGWTMTRVFHDGFGISWADAFSVADRGELEDLLAKEGIGYQWLPSGSLHTVRRRPGVTRHPVTGEECWFNQLAFLNASSMEQRERAILTEAFGDDLPMNTAFGDGTPLSETDLNTIQHAYDEVTLSVDWQSGDLLVIDNIMTAQGRAPFSGTAEFLIAFGGESPVCRKVGRQ
ncbi:TauD/TfdA family dioxygenase, partial [Nonomuraea sp. RK-328]|nr:TauD/TfdA family dioxygenase [Nonomuraea sp. RK-328]